MRECVYRRAGTWELTREPAYPGYVFAAVDNLSAFERLVSSSTLAAYGIHLMTTCSLSTAAAARSSLRLLTAEEAAFVQSIGGDQHVIRMSVGDVIDGQLVVRTGSLAGYEGLVSHVDRHRRCAWLRVGDALVHNASARGLRVGLEVVTKS